MTVNLIMAAENRGGIGKDGKIPWHDPEDLKWFKRMTMGHLIVVGYNTAQLLPELPGRHVLVMERDMSPDWVIHKHETIGWKEGQEIFVAGGAKTYAQWLPYVDRFHIGWIKGEHDCDTFTPFNLPWANAQS